MTNNPKAIIIACNTATAASHTTLCKMYPHIPVIGIEPAVRKAVLTNNAKQVLVLATEGTIASTLYKKQLDELDGYASIASVPAPQIVKYVEGGLKQRQKLKTSLTQLLKPYASCIFDGVILGCTHFPFAADVIEETLGYTVSFYDASSDVVEKTMNALETHGTKNLDTFSGSLRMANSTYQLTMLEFAWNLFAQPCVSTL